MLVMVDGVAKSVGADRGLSGTMVCIKPGISNSPFFAVGSHPGYRDFGARLDPDQAVYRLDVYAAQAERSNVGKRLLGSIEQIASRFLQDIRRLQPSGPYYLGGGCEGAVVAFELALQIQAQNEAVACLLMWTTPALLKRHSLSRHWLPVTRLARQLRGNLPYQSLRAMTPRDWRAYFHHEYIEYRIFRAVYKYSPATRYEGKLSLIWPEDVLPQVPGLAKRWRESATGGAEIATLPGRHANWLYEHAEELGDFLHSHITKALARVSEDNPGENSKPEHADHLEVPPEIDLPVDRNCNSNTLAVPVAICLPADLVSSLGNIALHAGSPQWVLYLAALEVLLGRHANQEQFVVGFSTYELGNAEAGCMAERRAQTEMLHADLSGNPTFLDVLEQTRSATQASSAADNVNCTSNCESRSISATAQSSGCPIRFELLSPTDDGQKHSDASSGLIDWRIKSGGQLNVKISLTGGQANVHFVYDPGRFCRQTIERWAGHYELLLTRITRAPDAGINDYVLLSDYERRRVTLDFNEAIPRRSGTPLLAAERLRNAARANPQSVAIEDGEVSVSYAEFDAIVDRIATSFLQRGLRAENRVVIYSDRSIASVAGIMGALRAGVAYIPIDPELTAEWLGQVLDQASPSAILTRPHLVGQVADYGPETFLLDDFIFGPPVKPVTGRAAYHDLAYILYTSGSSGQPKGVLIEQGQLACFLDAMAERQPLAPLDRTVLYYSLSFDPVATCIHAPLAAGATIVIREDTVISSIPRLLTWLGERKVTHFRCPASYFHNMAEHLLSEDQALPKNLRFIAFGGEQVRADLVSRWLKRFGRRVELHNNYGPTETTIWVTSTDLSLSLDYSLDWVPIGKPAAYSSVYVLDPQSEPCPIGVIGEMFIGGDLVGRGYLNQPGLTASRFLPDPFSKDHEARMYRTGDLGRWLPSGELEAIGRIDGQVKIRGFRVEPGELATALRRLPSVEDSAVVPRKGSGGRVSLDAYVSSDGSQLDVASLRNGLHAVLPSFLCPASITIVESWPRNVSGKLDVSALPDPVLTPLVSDQRPAGSAPTVTEPLISIWKEVLALEHVDPRADFFELGGNSLLAIRMVDRINDRLVVKLPITSLFEYTTVAELSEAICKAKQSSLSAQ